MNLRLQAALDARSFLESDDDFAWPVQLTNPAGVTAALKGYTTDIRQALDPETNQLVTGRVASVALPIAAITEAGLAIPKGISDGAGKPWVVVFDDIEGRSRKFKVAESRPDLAIGIVVLILEILTGP